MEELQKRPRKIVKRDITEEQFYTLLDRAIHPIEEQSDSASTQTSESRQSDGCSGKHTHLDRTEDI